MPKPNVDEYELLDEYEVHVVFRVRVPKDSVVTPTREAAEAAALAVAGPSHRFAAPPKVSVGVPRRRSVRRAANR